MTSVAPVVSSKPRIGVPPPLGEARHTPTTNTSEAVRSVKTSAAKIKKSMATASSCQQPKAYKLAALL